MKIYTNPQITFAEIATALLYFSFFMYIILKIASKYKHPSIKKYFIYGALAKIIGGQALCLVYIYVYKFGDTFRFFNFGLSYRDILLYSSEYSFFEALFMSNETFKDLISYKLNFAYAFVDSVFLINKLSGILSVFTFDSFLATTMFFSVLSFSGIWKLYETFIKMHPKLYKEMALAILFYPSVVFWGSGILKDTICISALGWLTWGLYNVFISKNKLGLSSIKYLIAILISFWIIKEIKIYIITAFLAGASIWIILSYTERIKNLVLRRMTIPIILSVSAILILYGLQTFSEELGEYSIDKVIDTALDLSYNLSKMDAGSTYDLGPIQPSLTGILSKLPVAVNVSLFRPYIWEVRNPIMILAAIESLTLLLSVIYIILKMGPYKFINNIFSNGLLFFCFVYSIIFLFATGLSSSNFGTLVRYKIPAMPFFVAAIIIQYYLMSQKSLFDNRNTLTYK